MSVKCLIYCTRGKLLERHWKKIDGIGKFILYHHSDKVKYCDINSPHRLNGKIVAEFDCEKVEEIRMLQDNNMTYETKTLIEEQLLIKSRLEGYQLGNYLGLLYENECGYALHLSNIKVFDKPLSFKTDYIYKDYKTNAILTKAPQNMCNVYDRFGNHYVLISIRPEYVAKILNGEKTIEVRRKILNCLKDLI